MGFRCVFVAYTITPNAQNALNALIATRVEVENLAPDSACQLTLNRLVPGSSPGGSTLEIWGPAGKSVRPGFLIGRGSQLMGESHLYPSRFLYLDPAHSR